MALYEDQARATPMLPSSRPSHEKQYLRNLFKNLPEGGGGDLNAVALCLEPFRIGGEGGVGGPSRSLVWCLVGSAIEATWRAARRWSKGLLKY